MDERERKLRDYAFDELAPSGYFVAFRVAFLRPEFEFNSLPRAWVLKYTQHGLMMHDPVMRWIYGNSGSVPWSQTGFDDTQGVLAEASQHGLNYGLAVSIVDPADPGIRSFGNFCRSDREYQPHEAKDLVGRLELFFTDLEAPADITEAEVEALRLLKNGLLIKEVAFELGISEGAVKQRLRGAKDKLNARTTPHAVSVASDFGLI
ncbi:MAG: autoinducer binding domain-containing protein [Paracoccaceae bacterium]|nr:autoinducer binding domain-containing protein [Paracoccaceae bacterium]